MYIEVKDAVKKYGEKETELFALNHVNFEMDKGEICVILGPSGSGKSTLLNMLGGIDSLTGGTIIVNGKDITDMNKKQLTEYRRQDVGFVFQSYNLIPDLTVRENVEVVADISGQPLDIDELLAQLEIDRHKNKFPKELSGGQQQRTAIARALVKNPSILLCDELTGALDSKSSRDVLRMLEKVNGTYKTTILIITHNEGIAAMADRVIRIHDGQIQDSRRQQQKKAVADLEI
ncbi:MAG: ABC transporter ATP-binding protein [Lachnospiraceae bacterium]|nr:ABC transporter ATP-binding protein [Lachnospiraceae bacterium]